MSEYDALVTALKASSIPFAEYGWATRPQTDFGIVGLDMTADKLASDDGTRMVTLEGSVDLYMHGRNATEISTIEGILEATCGASWERNSIQYETETRLLHYEWVFQLSGEPNGQNDSNGA